jgi:hypothetical protein
MRAICRSSSSRLTRQLSPASFLICSKEDRRIESRKSGVAAPRLAVPTCGIHDDAFPDKLATAIMAMIADAGTAEDDTTAIPAGAAGEALLLS